MSGPMERRSAIAGHLLPLIYSQDRAVLRAVIAALRDAPSSRGASPETVGIAQLLVLKAGGLSRGALQCIREAHRLGLSVCLLLFKHLGLVPGGSQGWPGGDRGVVWTALGWRRRPRD